MIIDATLAKMLVHQAVLAPYRQIDPIRSDRFVEWLRKRGIGLGMRDWQTLHHLWQIGVLHPVAVRDTADSGKSIPILATVADQRLIPVGEWRGGRVYADIGTDVAGDTPLRPPHSIPSDYRDALLWHPFQLWAFVHLDGLLRPQDRWHHMLSSPDQHLAARDQYWHRVLADVREFGRNDCHHSFLRLLALLLAAEPLVHPWIYPRVRLDPSERSLEQYFEWRESRVGYHLLDLSGLAIGEAVDWHRKLAFLATSHDPVEHWRKLLRHADRDEREKFEGDALCAHSLYDAAETLRRYLDRYRWYPLPDEADVIRSPARNARVNLDRYGRARTSDYERGMFRRIARQYQVDPGYRTYCFLEGPTEVGYVRRWADTAGVNLDQAGVRLISFAGKDNVGLFEDELRRLKEDEIFAVVCVDLDNPERSAKQEKHLGQLRKFEATGLLPVAFKVWTPNFVQHNFTTTEVLTLIVAKAAKREYTLTLSPNDIEHYMSHDKHGQPRNGAMPLEKAIDALVYQETGQRLVQKGIEWGELLADWAADHPAPPERAGTEGDRPIDAVCELLLRGQDSDYALTLELSTEARKAKQAEREAEDM